MAKKVKVIVLRTAGTNCNAETSFAFESFGASVDEVHINQLVSGKVKLKDYHIMAIPGGFSYGDDIASGRILANELRLNLGDQIRKFIKDGKLVIGICNGFQVLVKTGILPGLKGSGESHQTVTLTHNDSAKFEDRWTYLKASGNCVWTESVGAISYIPVAHAEGKFIVENEAMLKELQSKGLIVFRYCSQDGSDPDYPENPNGAMDDIAGITDLTGRVLGMMPHPERHFLFTQHPAWTRAEKRTKYGDGAKIFENGVNYVKKNLL